MTVRSPMGAQGRIIAQVSSPLRRAGLVALQCLIVLVSVAMTSVVAAGVQERSIRAATEERVLDVARSLAGLAQVRESVVADRAAATESLQPLADTVLAASGVDYVVITDADGIRLTHPVAAERGRPVSTDPGAVLDGETFLGTETGTLGPTLRAKVPVFDGDAVVGTVSVGILESEIAASFQDAVFGMLPWIVASAVLGCLAAALVTGMLNRRMRVLAAQARELQTQRRIAGALREQTHEFHTRLHVLRGLVAHGEVPEALDYIGELVPVTDASAPPAAAPPRDGVDRAAGDARLRALLDGLSAELRQRGTELRVTGGDPGEAVPEELLTAIANLCRNAAEAGAGVVQVRWGGDETALRVAVEDDGPGIPAEDRARLFQRGVSTKPDPAGLGRGIGLDLVRRSVSALDGTVEVGRSSLGGARFAIEAPRAGT